MDLASILDIEINKLAPKPPPELIVIEDESVKLLERDVGYYKEELVNNLANLRIFRKGVETSSKYLEDADNKSLDYFFKNKRIPEHIRKTLEKTMKHSVQQSLQSNRAYKQDIASETRNKDRNRKTLNIRVKQLKVSKETCRDKRLHLNDVRMALIDFKNIDTDRLAFKIVNGVPHLILYYINVVCTPDRISYANILDTSWVLPDIRVVMNLLTGHSSVYNADDVKYAPKGYSGYRPHPHIINADKPCYGDFLGATVDAKEHLDIAEMVTVMQLFLEQTYIDDGAGSYYARFMACKGSVPDIRGKMETHRHLATHEGLNYYGRNISEDRSEIAVVKGGVTKIHKVDNNKLDAFLNGLKK